ncbi:MAG: ornithine carbamoyltransferase [Planctomycetaceae bacterium]
MQHLTSLYDITANDFSELIELAVDLKKQTKAGERPSRLKNRVLLQIFEKPSLRTRNSFESAIIQLGGGGIFMSAQEAGFAGRESLSDIATVSSSYADFVTLRTFSQRLIDDYAQHSSCPVINALSDDRHPCQALTDYLTVHEAIGRTNDVRFVFVGDGNNVSASLAIASALAGSSFVLACPEGYELQGEFVEDLKNRFPNVDLTQTNNPAQAVADADIVYTDVWASMGQEAEARKREQDFSGFQVNEELMSKAPASCKFMHDLPARRGLEVTDGVMDGENSICFQQAENRMHLAKALFVWLSEKAS